MRRPSRDASDSATPARPAASPRTIALRYLGRRDYTTLELTEKLVTRGVEIEAARATVADLVAAGLVDDRRAAAAHVRTAGRVKGRGPRRIRLELQARGVEADAITEALGQIDAAEMADTLARIVARQHPSRPIPCDARNRLFRQLLRRGFPAPAIDKALK